MLGLDGAASTGLTSGLRRSRVRLGGQLIGFGSDLGSAFGSAWLGLDRRLLAALLGALPFLAAPSGAVPSPFLGGLRPAPAGGSSRAFEGG